MRSRAVMNGDERYRKGFLFLPRTCKNGISRWLEYACWRERIPMDSVFKIWVTLEWLDLSKEEIKKLQEMNK